MADAEPTYSGNEKHSLTTNAVTRFVAEGIMLVAAQATAILLARTLGPAGKGLASLLVLIFTSLIKIADMGLTFSGLYYVGKRVYRPQNVVSTFAALGIVLGLAIAFGLIGLRHQLSELLFKGEYSELPPILAIGIPASLLYNWFSGVLRGKEALIAVSSINAIASLAAPCVLAVLLYVVDAGTVSIVWATNSTVIVGVIGTAYVLKRQGIGFTPRLDLTLLRDSIGYGLRGQVGQILQFINYRFDLFVVNYFLGMASVGVYGVGAGISMLIWQVPNALAFALYSRVSAVGVGEANALTVRVARQAMLLSLLMAVAAIPAGYIGIPLIFGDAFRAAVPAMWLLLPGVVALSYYKTLGVHLAGQGHPEYYSYGAAVSAVATLVLDFALIPRFGINGAAVASSVAYTLNGALCIYWFTRVTGLPRVSRLFIPEYDDLRVYYRFARRFV